jgi:uncharacterized membrane protein
MSSNRPPNQPVRAQPNVLSPQWITKRPNETWLQHALRRTGWRPRRQVIAVGTLGVLYLSQVAMEASRGRQMRTMIADRDELERQNEELRVEIAEMESLPRLQARARDLGFVEANSSQIRYMVVEGYTANRQATVVQQEDVEDQTQLEYNETFDNWVGNFWGALRSQFEGFNQVNPVPVN